MAFLTLMIEEDANDVFCRTIARYKNLLICLTANIQGRSMNHMASIQKIFVKDNYISKDR